MDVQDACKDLRILLVGSYPPPYGGIASHLTMLIPGLLARGARDVAVVTFGGKESIDSEHGATIYRFHLRKHIKKFFMPQAWKAVTQAFITLKRAKLDRRRLLEEMMKVLLILDIAKKHRSDVVSFYQSDVSFALLPCAQIWGSRKRTFLTIFGEVYDTPDFFQKRLQFMEQLLNRPERVLSSSKHCACSFKKAYGISRDVLPIYYGVDPARFSRPNFRAASRKKFKLADDDVLLIFMGRFTEEMGVQRIIDVMPELFKKQPKLKLILAGNSGPLSEDAARLAEAHSDNVSLLQNIPFDVQPSLYAASDVVLAPTRDQHACMGMSIKEAMAASRPVIGSYAGGVPEAIVHDETGYLIEMDDEKQVDKHAFSNAILALANDAKLRDSMGRAARERVDELFCKEKTIDRLAGLFVGSSAI